MFKLVSQTVLQEAGVQLRKRVLNLTDYYVFDAFVPLVEDNVKYAYDDVLDWIVEAVAPLGAATASCACRAWNPSRACR